MLLTLDITEADHKKIKIAAAMRNISMKKLILASVEMVLKESEKQETV